ncbi:MAG: DUF2066 domain-containing protein [Holosporales bacterium]
MLGWNINSCFRPFIGAFCLMTVFCWANPDLYEVRDVRVEITAETTIAARDQALQQAQNEAFQQLLSRLIPEKQGDSLTNLKQDVLEDLVQDFEILDERFSKTRYSATFIVRFKPDAIAQVLREKGLQTNAQLEAAEATPGPGLSPIAPAPHEAIVDIVIRSHADWQRALALLQKTFGHTRVMPLTLSRQHAKVTLTFAGDRRQLEERLRALGLPASIESGTPEPLQQNEGTP